MGHYLLSKVEKILEKKRDIVSSIKDEKIVLYPYGEMGSYVESWLKENFNIVPCFYIDNFKADGKRILSIDQALEREKEEFIVLIVSDSVKYYDEIRRNIYNALCYTKIIDLFEIAKEDFCSLRKEISMKIEETQKHEPSILRKAYSLAEYFERKPIELNSNDILVGNLERITQFDMIPSNTNELLESCKEYIDEQIYNYMWLAEKNGIFCCNMGLHIIPAYSVLLRDGIQVRMNKVKENFDKTRSNVSKAQLIAMQAFQKYILRCAEEARKENLSDGTENDIYEGIKSIAYNPPNSLYEAIQLLIFLHIGVIDEAGSISLGRLDRILYPYYESDIKSGMINREYVQRLITELYKKLSKLEQSWQNVTLGGSDSFGNDQSNELTIMCLNASLDVDADQPQISLRVNRNMPQAIWDKAFELIKTGRGVPALFNDEVAVKAKMSAGISEEDAWNYGIVGCVELSACGKEYSHTEGMRINWAKVLELMIYGDEHGLLSSSYCLEQFKSFEDFYETFKKELSYVTKQCCTFLEQARYVYSKRWATPFTSCIMEGCIENGKDVTDSGTIYNNMTINAVGVASTVDSLQAIDTLVFEKKKLSLEELKEVLSSNFKSDPIIYKECQECSKFGNDLEDVDKKAVELVQLFTKTVKEFPTTEADAFQVGYYTSYFHSDFGKMTKALPDGKKNGLPLSSSLSPVSGMDNNGPIGVLNSLNKIDMSEMANGMVLDMKFVKQFFEKKENVFGLQELIKTYFQRGGMEIQFNVVDKQTLIEAQKSPFKYKNLVVRVSGFSSYFVDLDKELQDEIISRTANV